MMMQWEPDDEYDDDGTAQPGYQEPQEPHAIRHTIIGALYLSVMILVVMGVIWVALLMGTGK